MKNEYIIIKWHYAQNNGSACLYRTNDETRFERKKIEILKRYKPFKDITVTRVYNTETGIRMILSFADNPIALHALLNAQANHCAFQMIERG